MPFRPEFRALIFALAVTAADVRLSPLPFHTKATPNNSVQTRNGATYVGESTKHPFESREQENLVIAFPEQVLQVLSNDTGLK